MKMELKNAVVTINYNNFICENVRDSFQSAAKRWDAEYFEINENTGIKDVLPHFQKLKIFDIVDADRVFYIDADAIISEKAPSPFDVCPVELFGVVRNSSDRMWDQRELEVKENADIEVLSEYFSENIIVDNYFNAGMMVFSKNHQKMLDYAWDIFVNIDIHKLVWNDQPVLNFSASKLMTPMLYMGEEWNFMGHEEIDDWTNLDKFIYHFAGTGNRHTILKGLQWRKDAEEDVFQKFEFLIPANGMKATGNSCFENGCIKYPCDVKDELNVFYPLTCYGPYITLQPGKYIVNLHVVKMNIFKLRNYLLPQLRVQLTGSFSKKIIKRKPFWFFSKKHSISFSVDKKINYFELKIHALSTCNFNFNGFSIKKVYT